MQYEKEPRETMAVKMIDEVMLPDGIWYQVAPETFSVYSPLAAGNPKRGDSAFFRFQHLDTKAWFEAPLRSLIAYTSTREDQPKDDSVVIIPE